jgi:hypothetical protein
MKALEIFKSNAMPEHLIAIAKLAPESAAGKIDHIAHMINLINSEAKKIKQEEAGLKAKRTHLEMLVECAESSLKEEMTAEGICDLHGEMIKYSVAPSPHKLIIDDPELIPKEYKVEVVTVELRKDAIKDELKIGTVIPGAHLEQGTTLKLSANKG